MNVTTSTSVREQMVQELELMSDEMIAKILPMVQLFNKSQPSGMRFMGLDGAPVAGVTMLPSNELTVLWNLPEEDEAWQDLQHL